MQHKIITIKNHAESELAATRCKLSSKNAKNNFNLEIFDAIVPDQVDDLMKKFKLEWTYPDVHRLNYKAGLHLHPYTTANLNARIGCALSHYILWKECFEKNEPILILEHDAKFLRKLDYDYILKSNFDIIGINDPIFATRRDQFYRNKIQNNAFKEKIIPVPTIDDDMVPQGLAGNSAYIIKPRGADQMLKAAKYYGLWPNDALMCKQLIKRLGVTSTFYTTIQRMEKSTTRDA